MCRLVRCGGLLLPPVSDLRSVFRSTLYQLRLLRWRIDYWFMVREYEASLKRKG